MTLFEYLAGATSIVLALAVVRLVEGLRPAVASENRYWVHCGWLVAKIISCLIFWWNLWGAHEQVSWNFAYFAFIFVGPIILYVQASALVPQDPTAVHSWREHFMTVHQPFYVANALYLLHLIVSPIVLLGLAPRTAIAVISFAITVSVAGAVLKTPRAQEVIAVLSFATIAISIATVLFDPISIPLP